VTLVAPGTSDGPHTPEDFHRQLIKVLAELSHAAVATIVRPICDEAPRLAVGQRAYVGVRISPGRL
jgi:hypothetical protein